MITIFLGEDTVSSRKNFIQLRSTYTEKGYEIYPLALSNLSELDKWLYQSEGLFQLKKAFFGENLLSKKEHRKLLEAFDTTDTNVDIVIWEEKIEDRIAKFFFKHAKINSHKLPASIFSYLDSLIPGNLSEINSQLTTINESIDENIIFFMTVKRIRELILVSEGKIPGKKLATWQIARLSTQAKKWDINNLLSFYEALYRIDVQNKTSSNYYSLNQALDILFCYYVR
jgi:hypothetical protein